jgi:hypothetical protein
MKEGWKVQEQSLPREFEGKREGRKGRRTEGI